MSDDLIYLVVAYAVLWGATFGLVFSMWRRQRRIEGELSALQARLGEEDVPAPR
jgi:CcmD family protein